jgi:hypothetical protein
MQTMQANFENIVNSMAKEQNQKFEQIIKRLDHLWLVQLELQKSQNKNDQQILNQKEAIEIRLDM